MCRLVAIAMIALFAFASSAFAGDSVRAVGSEAASRFYVVKILHATGLIFGKETGPTNFVFQLEMGDSIKVDCEGCMVWLDQPSVQGDMAMALQFPGGVSPIHRAELGKWIAPYGKAGKIALVFQRDGVGERYLPLAALKVYRKTNAPLAVTAGKAMGLLEVNQLSLPRLDRGGKGQPTLIWTQCGNLDQCLVKVVANDGQVPTLLVGNVFKIGEEFAKQPLTFAEPMLLPAQGQGNSLFGFEFAEAAAANGMKAYHIDIDRIPMHGAGDPSMYDE